MYYLTINRIKLIMWLWYQDGKHLIKYSWCITSSCIFINVNYKVFGETARSVVCKMLFSYLVDQRRRAPSSSVYISLIKDIYIFPLPDVRRTIMVNLTMQPATPYMCYTVYYNEALYVKTGFVVPTKSVCY